MSPGDRFDLTAAILERTTGPVCGRAREVVVNHSDQPVDPATDALLFEHLQHCVECQAFASAWQESARMLLAFAELDPGPAFSGEVLALTTRRKVSPWTAWWARVVARPRFSLEAAYVIASLCILLAGNPVALAGAVAERVQSLAAEAGAATDPEGGVPTAGATAGSTRSVVDLNRVTNATWWDKLSARVSGWWNALANWMSDMLNRLWTFLGGKPASTDSGSAEGPYNLEPDAEITASEVAGGNLTGARCV